MFSIGDKVLSIKEHPVIQIGEVYKILDLNEDKLWVHNGLYHAFAPKDVFMPVPRALVGDKILWLNRHVKVAGISGKTNCLFQCIENGKDILIRDSSKLKIIHKPEILVGDMVIPKIDYICGVPIDRNIHRKVIQRFLSSRDWIWSYMLENFPVWVHDTFIDKVNKQDNILKSILKALKESQCCT